MTTLCSGCQQKTPMQFVGHCVKCQAPTTSFHFQLCDGCSQQLGECAWCRSPLQGGSSPTPTSAGCAFVVKKDADNGATVKGMKIGEQVRVELLEDRYSGKQWGFKTSSRGIQLMGTPSFVQDPNNPQYGTRIFLFDLTRSGTGTIDLHEVSGYYYWGGGGGGPIAGGKTYQLTVVVQ